MRYYANAEIKLSRSIPEEVITDFQEYKIGDIYFDQKEAVWKYELEWEEYFVDEIEFVIKSLSNYAEENNITLTGYMEMECDGEKGEYIFSGGTEYEEFWGNDYYLRNMGDEEIIKALESRGYTVTKKGA